MAIVLPLSQGDDTMAFQALGTEFSTYTDQWATNTALFCDSVADYIKSDWLTRYNVTALCLSYNMRELPYLVATAMVIGLVANALFQIISLGTLSANPALAIALLLACRYIIGKSFKNEEDNSSEKKPIEQLFSSLFGNFITNEGRPIEWANFPAHVAELLRQ
jgi:hypothetical protein